MRTAILCAALALGALASPLFCPAQTRLVLIGQDASGPGGSDQMAMLALLQSPDVEVLGITIVTGDAWRDEETLHTLRMLELTGHADVPVARGAVFPLVRTQEGTRLETALDGKGRVLLRPSGTEPLLRVMVEGEDGAAVRHWAEAIAQTVREAAQG